jgi:hypothetical protein
LITLRVGICGCTSRFHGKFSRKILYIPRRGGVLRVRLVERTIAENDYRSAIRAARIHFFLDTHSYLRSPMDKRTWHFTDIYRVDFRPSMPGRKQRIYIGGLPRHGKHWDTLRIPSAKAVLAKLYDLINEVEPDRLSAWLGRVGDSDS